jgi:hypothetical protein
LIGRHSERQGVFCCSSRAPCSTVPAIPHSDSVRLL